MPRFFLEIFPLCQLQIFIMFLSRLSCHGRKHSQTIFTIEILIKILAASTCIIDFFCKSMRDKRKSAFRLQQVIALRHSIALQCNLVHEQTILSPTSCSKKLYDLILSFLHNFGFSKKWHFADYTTNIGP